MGSKCLRYTALTISIIGAVNWGLIGFFNLNLVALLFGSMSWISRIIYGLVGICGLCLLTFYSDSACEYPRGHPAKAKVKGTFGVISYKDRKIEVPRAIDGARTRGLDLGKVARYQLRHYRTSG